MFYKIHYGLVDITLPQIIRPNPRPGRGQHQLRYHHLQTNLDVYRYSFFPRIIPVWNMPTFCSCIMYHHLRLLTWQQWPVSGSCSRRPTARDSSLLATLQFFVCLVCTWTTRTLMSASRTAVNAYIGSHLSSIK